MASGLNGAESPNDIYYKTWITMDPSLPEFPKSTRGQRGKLDERFFLLPTLRAVGFRHLYVQLRATDTQYISSVRSTSLQFT